MHLQSAFLAFCLVKGSKPSCRHTTMKPFEGNVEQRKQGWYGPNMLDVCMGTFTYILGSRIYGKCKFNPMEYMGYGSKSHFYFRYFCLNNLRFKSIPQRNSQLFLISQLLSKSSKLTVSKKTSKQISAWNGKNHIDVHAMVFLQIIYTPGIQHGTWSPKSLEKEVLALETNPSFSGSSR